MCLRKWSLLEVVITKAELYKPEKQGPDFKANMSDEDCCAEDPEMSLGLSKSC